MTTSKPVAGALLATSITLMATTLSAGETGWPEKDELSFGFIKLTDMAPLAIAYERGYFEDEFLFVELEAQSNWRVLLDRVISGELDGAHMLAGQPIAATVGYGNQANIITPFSMDLNGNATTLSNEVWDIIRPHLPENEDGNPVHPITADYLQPALEQFADDGRSFNMGMVFPVSTHNYELRYWLAAGGIHPGYYDPAGGDTSGQIGADVYLSVTPPPQMPSTLEAGTISGYNVGEPWNQQAVFMQIGVPVVTNHDIWNYNPEKVFGIREDFAEEYPNTTVRIVKALIRAAYWLDENNNANREEAARILSEPHYVGADYEVIANSMTGTFEFEPGDVRDVPDFNVFFREHATYPIYSDAIWFLTQMRRWGQIEEHKPDDWYMEMARSIYRPDLYEQAARDLIAEGIMSADDFPDFDNEDGFKPATSAFIDGMTFDARFPNDYLDQFDIGLTGDDTP
ncbi:nitrate ABC transporter substrate-binding protein [Natronospirillum operosum]|uniref:Nitrate ABC transporter substrate-binding protein n=1 Tax=Natronospirillum operosum TaxID=2759953 RepID=A0A4Z0WIX2_9GAMM|nr:CmpA/NrtA family ABC transporter substrate-binding protein [Natronospirillum operosum]TGG95413.1 nitrate ABC transporter substrate-binding protein [Natronospirillum operosum]